MDSRKVFKFLKQYNQQQSYEVIRDAVDENLDRGDLDRLVEEGKLKHADGGKDGYGNPIKHYELAEDPKDD